MKSNQNLYPYTQWCKSSSISIQIHHIIPRISFRHLFIFTSFQNLIREPFKNLLELCFRYEMRISRSSRTTSELSQLSQLFRNLLNFKGKFIYRNWTENRLFSDLWFHIKLIPLHIENHYVICRYCDRKLSSRLNNWDPSF